MCSQSNDILKEKQIMLLEKRYTELISDSRKAGMKLDEIVNLVKVLYEEE